LLSCCQVIAELDEKKREALEKTWRKVNQDFGSIFSMLLPGTFAKLEPPEECTFLDGEKLLQNTAAAAHIQVLTAADQYRSDQDFSRLLPSTSAKWELPEDGSFFEAEKGRAICSLSSCHPCLIC